MRPEDGCSSETIRRLLHRRDLASSRFRAAISRQLGLSETEMLVVAHLAHHGRLSPSSLGELLDLSSGGVTALVQRLQSAGHLIRHRHPTDGRSVLVELSPELRQRAERAFEPLVRDLDAASRELSAADRVVVRRFLGRVTALSEAHARKAREAATTGQPTAAQSPGLWG